MSAGDGEPHTDSTKSIAAGDLGVTAAARRSGLQSTPAALRGAANAWRRWRAYAVQHLWATGDHAVNVHPT